MTIIIPIYKYRVIGGDFVDPSSHQYKEMDFYKESTRSNLGELSDDFRSYELVGESGYYQLDSRWKADNHSGGYTDNRHIVDNLDDFAGFIPSEGVIKVNASNS